MSKEIIIIMIIKQNYPIAENLQVIKILLYLLSYSDYNTSNTIKVYVIIGRDVIKQSTHIKKRRPKLQVVFILFVVVN